MPRGKAASKQQEILEYIKQEIIRRGYPPSVREICSAVNLKSTSSVHAHLASLEKNGLIRRDPTKPRAIEIMEPSFYTAGESSSFVQVPIVGRVAAGEPILAEENIQEWLPIPANRMPSSDAFLLEIHGESMINAGILDGDYVLIRSQKTANNGDKVVALLDDSATVKTFYREDGHFRLQPENDSMDPIIVKDDLQIIGKVVGVFRYL